MRGVQWAVRRKRRLGKDGVTPIVGPRNIQLLPPPLPTALIDWSSYLKFPVQNEVSKWSWRHYRASATSGAIQLWRQVFLISPTSQVTLIQFQSPQHSQETFAAIALSNVTRAAQWDAFGSTNMLHRSGENGCYLPAASPFRKCSQQSLTHFSRLRQRSVGPNRNDTK